MSKITSFTFDEFWDTQDKYNDMLETIEERVLEVANSLGHAYLFYQLTDVYFTRDDYHMYVVGEFTLQDGSVENVQFKTEWLFIDDYQKEIDEKEARRAQKEAEEYREYLRLKEKFERKK